MLNHFLATLVTMIPALSGTYAINDQMGGASTLVVADSDRYGGVIQSVTVVDRSNQGYPLDIYFFSESPTSLAGDNQPFRVSDDEMTTLVLGVVSFARTDFTLSAGASVATLRNAGMYFKAGKQGSKSIYAVPVARSLSPTFSGGPSDLVIKIGVRQD